MGAEHFIVRVSDVPPTRSHSPNPAPGYPRFDHTLIILARLDATRGNLKDAVCHTHEAVVEAYRQGQRDFLRTDLQGALLTAATLGELEVAAVLAGVILKGALRAVGQREGETRHALHSRTLAHHGSPQIAGRGALR